MSFVISGVPREISPGVFVGATDFSEFAAFVGMIAPSPGITMTNGATGPTVINAGGLEGFGIQKSDGEGLHAMGIDSFRGFFGPYGEFLVRLYQDGPAFSSGGRWKYAIGPFTVTAGPNVALGVSLVYQVNSGVWSVRDDSSAGASTHTETVSPKPANDTYFWLRVRYTDIGGGMANLKAHITESAFDAPPDPPVAWLYDEDLNFFQGLDGVADDTWIGWIRGTIGPTSPSDRRYTFFSWTSDPNFPPSLPSETLPEGTTIIPPTVTVDPLQHTWVGLVGSPFETFV
jgi:hypothetical protein